MFDFISPNSVLKEKMENAERKMENVFVFLFEFKNENWLKRIR